MKTTNYSRFKKDIKDRKLLEEGEGLLNDFFHDFYKLYEISHNSEKLFITLSSVILVASFSFVKLLPNAEFKTLLLGGWISFCLVDVIIIWNQIHYRIALADKRLYLSLNYLRKMQKVKRDDEIKKILTNFGLAMENINYSINNSQLLFITGILFLLGFSIVNFNIIDFLKLPVILFLIGWIIIVIKNFKTPLLYKND